MGISPFQLVFDHYYFTKCSAFDLSHSEAVPKISDIRQKEWACTTNHFSKCFQKLSIPFLSKVMPYLPNNKR